MFLRLFTPRFLLLALLGVALPMLAWQTLDPLARYGRLRADRWEASRCRSHMRTLAGAIEMYSLDFDTVVEVVDQGLLLELVDQGYLQRIPAHGNPRCYDPAGRRHDARTPYVVATQAHLGLVCRQHGEGSNYYPYRPLTSGLGFLAQEATPFAAGAGAVLLLQGLWAWGRRRRGHAPDEAAEELPEWFSDPVFKPASKAVIAKLGVGACCPVCSQDLVGGVESMVECLRCETPHHLDCAGYTARCGVYGCGEGGGPS